MRIILIVLGLIVILGLLGHGLWSIRKGQGGARRNPRSKKQGAHRNTEATNSRQVDASGFDQDGIGQVRTIKATSSSVSGVASNKKTEAKPVKEKPLVEKGPKEKKEPSIAQPSLSQQTLFEELEEEQVTKQEKPRQEPSIGAEQISLGFDDEPEISKPEQEEHEAEEPHAEPTSEADDSDDEQLQDHVTDEQETGVEGETDGEHEAQENDIEVITLFVSGDIQGAILLQTLTELGLKFGEMDIFHRHEDTAGKGPKLFSIANMYNPGVFDLDGIENFSTRGVALFMTLPIESDGHNAFTMMYNAANKIAEAMPRAAVLDGNRNPITKQSVQHTYQKIREFERRQKIAGASR
ncbi:cell division protein ZipA [Aliidiomarina sp. B3213]|uniref:cell division protein ZipA n=1 Tax=Aliidiomarina sp. B3213 TaxID=2249757 RepID=UPI001402DE2A|nr:cell division protein ZipA [Aliidiomarina sp. B3213]